MHDGRISNQSITSSHHPKYPPWNARSWYAFARDDKPWNQVDIGKLTWLQGVVTQGKMFTLFCRNIQAVLFIRRDRVVY